MARVVVASAAYLGDVAPYVPPANLLAARGHEVAFLAPPGFSDLLAREHFALATYPLDFSPKGMHADHVHERLMRHPWRNIGRLGRYWMKKGFVDDPDAARLSLLDAFLGADVVVSHPTFATVTAPVARHLDVPLVVGQLFPMMIPTQQWSPPLGQRSLDLTRFGNRAAWTFLAQMTRLGMHDRALNRLRESLGQPSERAVALRGWMQADRTVVLVSRHYHGDGAAGVPVVVVPQLFDQLWHGRRVEDLGVGLLARKPKHVPAAVARIEGDAGYARRARELAAHLTGEDGSAALADAVESVL